MAACSGSAPERCWSGPSRGFPGKGEGGVDGRRLLLWEFRGECAKDSLGAFGFGLCRVGTLHYRLGALALRE
uniref:Uncharacterized protein n=1 Tax=Candidatus Kentrum eta TaxID=2126337 RepID=A0A450UI61_9GAMM|nr:MAG: hypothetical protein BECKH772A_GA0070896_1002814 [Candidatus Kentron sp. H]VFJ92225.1 MAG: hypothetical protein BECKH772B_GA0070898_1002614 [Candidatus Kentron sp. H]VFJ98886.1 MAG: hypothetical protein BECKH772C_GA0070978_1002614 [Candidatus Kentron sp. H]